ncbi:MAG TPA: hypothetical protein VNM37_14880, partial [Candidatus Dormibacteraeota bacterium]|nr:hypothetical protein [Candidatus Dormibacteraeota bacterium]
MQAFLISLGARVRPAGLAIGLTIFAYALTTVCLLAAAAAEVDLSKLPAASTRQMDFARDIEPIFAEHCYTCHGAKKQ